MVNLIILEIYVKRHVKYMIFISDNGTNVIDPKLDSDLRTWFIAFSLRSNCKQIFNSTRKSDVKCLHGLRVLCLLWVLVGHRYMLTSMFPVGNSTIFKSVQKLIAINNLPV